MRRDILRYKAGDGGEWGLVDFQAMVNEATVPLGDSWRHGWVCGKEPRSGRLEVWPDVVAPCADKLEVTVEPFLVTVAADGGLVASFWELSWVAGLAMRKMGYWKWLWRMYALPFKEAIAKGLPSLWWGGCLGGRMLEALGAERVFEVFGDDIRKITG